MQAPRLPANLTVLLEGGGQNAAEYLAALDALIASGALAQAAQLADIACASFPAAQLLFIRRARIAERRRADHRASSQRAQNHPSAALPRRQ